MYDKRKTIIESATTIAAAMIESLGKIGAAVAEAESGLIVDKSIKIAKDIYDKVYHDTSI